MAAIVAVGAGDKGALLLERWSQNGHETADDPAAVRGADVVVVDASAAEADLQRLGNECAGKIVIDCTNVAGVADLRSKTSVAEHIAASCPGALVVKAFNVVGVDMLRFLLKQRGPEVFDTYTSGYYCGDDAKAKSTVAGLMAETNLDPVDCGPLANAMLLESLGVLRAELAPSCGPIFSISLARAAGNRSPLDSVL